MFPWLRTIDEDWIYSIDELTIGELSWGEKKTGMKFIPAPNQF
jgi:hypothetical protein